MRIADADEAMLPQILEIERACFSDPWTPEILRSQLSERAAQKVKVSPAFSKAAGSRGSAPGRAPQGAKFPLPRERQQTGHIFLAALDSDTVLGYAGLTYVLDEGSITNVAVAPAWRRRGTADALLRELERRARTLALAFLTLEVRAGNAPAIALYEKHGYKPVGRRRNYYEKPVEDALLMTLMLETET